VTSPPQPSGRAPHSAGIPDAPKVRWPSLVAIAALVLAAVAAAMAGVALSRSSSPANGARPSSNAPARSTEATIDQAAAAQKDACDAWRAAAIAVNAARKPFINSPPARENPITANALAQAEAVNAVEVAWLRQHLRAFTPRDVAGPINEYVEAIVDVAAADAQPGADADANAAATRSVNAANKIKAACGM
jgi:hypothetical protein